MTIGEILNSISCGATDVWGTGVKGCKFLFKKVVSVWLLPTGFEFDSAETFDATYIQTLQAEGNLVILKGIRTFTDNTGDDTMDELEDGTKNVARLALYEFACQFVNGVYYHMALHSLNSVGNFDAVFVDREGNVLGTQSANGKLKGFTVGYIQGMKFSWATDSQFQREGIMFQLLDRTEVDNTLYYIQQSNLGTYRPDRSDGINEAIVELTPTPAAGTSITAVVTRKQDGQPVTGLAYTDFLVTDEGATSNPTADDSEATGDGIYVLTIAAFTANDDLTCRLYDVANNNAVINKTGDLYKSNIAAATAV